MSGHEIQFLYVFVPLELYTFILFSFVLHADRIFELGLLHGLLFDCQNKDIPHFFVDFGGGGELLSAFILNYDQSWGQRGIRGFPFFFSSFLYFFPGLRGCTSGSPCVPEF